MFMVKEEAKQETIVKQVANSAGFFLGLFFDHKTEAICSAETSVDFQRNI
jgi:hypothetical protein